MATVSNSIVYEYLTNSEKLEIITSHIKSTEYSIYNLEISKLESKSSDQSAEIDTQIADFMDRIDVLKTAKAALIA